MLPFDFGVNPGSHPSLPWVSVRVKAGVRLIFGFMGGEGGCVVSPENWIVSDFEVELKQIGMEFV